MRYWLTNGLEMGVKAPLEPLPMPSTGTASHYCHNMQLQNVYFPRKTGADFFSEKSVLWKLELLVGDKPPNVSPKSLIYFSTGNFRIYV